MPVPDAVEGVGGGGGEPLENTLLGEDGAALKAQGQEGGLLAELTANPGVEKGEYCVVADLSMLPPAQEPQAAADALVVMLAAIVHDEISIADAAQRALDAGCPRNEVYRAKLKLQDMFEEE